MLANIVRNQYNNILMSNTTHSCMLKISKYVIVNNDHTSTLTTSEFALIEAGLFSNAATKKAVSNLVFI